MQSHPEHPNALLTKENIHALKLYVQMCNKVTIMDENSDFVSLMTLHIFTSFLDFKFKVLYEKWYPGFTMFLNKQNKGLNILEAEYYGKLETSSS